MLETNGTIYAFDGFQIDRQKRLLLRDGRPVQLTAKCFDLLLALIENSGREISKDELLERIWPDQVVEEGNLTVTMSHLRKALGEKAGEHRFIVTIPGRGYCFVGNLEPANRSLIVEERSAARVTIEQEIEETPRRESQPVIQYLPAETKNKWIGLALLSGGGALILAIVLGFWFLRSNNRTAVSGSPTVHRFATHGGVPFYVAISRDGKSLAYTQRLHGKYSLWVGNIEANSSVPIYERSDISRVVQPSFSPDGANVYFLVGREDRPVQTLARIPVLGGAITELIPDVDSPVTFSPDGKQMAFLRRRANESSIVIADALDGKNEQVLITRKAPETISSVGLSWSFDGQSIAFGSNKAGGRDEVLAVSVTDQRVKRVGNRDWGAVENVAWAPDGSGILAIGKENAGERLRQIWFVPDEDGDARQITSDLNVFLQDPLSVSADGKVAVVQGVINAEVWVAPNADVRQAHRVLNGVAPRYEGIDGLAWTPDGRLLYTAYVADSNTIWSMNGDGTNLRQLTPSKANVFDREISVTADGRYVVFQSNRSGGSEIWRANLDGSDLKQLTTGGGNSLPAVSPDSRWIVYLSSRGGKTTLWRISIDGDQAKQLTDKSSSYPQVSPDGKYISYTSPADGENKIMIIPFEGGEPVKSFSILRTGFSARRVIRWTPDGKAIIYKNDAEGLWRQELDEEKPQLFKGFEELNIRQLAWSFDGSNLAYTTGLVTQEIVLIENFK